jgi:hypothetical protein
MNYIRTVVTTSVLGLVLILFWGCQNAKPVGPMKYVTLNATISTKGIVEPNGISAGTELLYRITGPSMNPVSGKVTVGTPAFTLEDTASAPQDMASPQKINFTVNIPAGPSRTLAIQLNDIMGQGAIRSTLTDPIQVRSIGAVRFDVDPGTQVVNVPVEMGSVCFYPCFPSIGTCLYPSDNCYFNAVSVAYMGNTDLVNCAFVPESNAFSGIDTCWAKESFYGISQAVGKIVKPSKINTGLEVGDVYCFTDYYGGHYWAQVAEYMDEQVYLRWRYNSSLPYYAFQENGCSGPVDTLGPN